ncbi:hypothetical protein M408DRAFT_22507 [Serendipita vermifera MAFF 305830]|uniref:F-box domain-containing protein n=1 Tax=Serendipita vermifera MAFF 305830 TaxID=933852 RepID=A0A0C2WVD3_SERVB|nr:hypothetical protein M408DRAFT_22507 [Serendipita vermifera MAFF 305830]
MDIGLNFENDDRVLDPIERLPPEVVVQCVQETLSAGDCSSRLLELTSVSKKWQALLFSTSILWTEVHIDWTYHDLLARTALFVHLSWARPIQLIVWDHPAAKWDVVGKLLVPSRICALTVRSVYADSYEPTAHKTIRYINTFANIYNSLNALPALKSLAFDRPLELEAPQLKQLTLPPGAFILSKVQLIDLSTGFDGETCPMVTNLVLFEDLNPCLVALSSFSSLQTLSMPSVGIPFQMEPLDLPQANRFLRLVDLTHSRPYSTNIDHLIRSCVPTLVRLSLQVTPSDTDEVINLLSLVINLEELSLQILSTPDSMIAKFVACRVQIPSLRSLKLEIYGFQESMVLDGSHPQLRIFAALANLYPNVTSLSISGISFRISYVLLYIQTLSRLDSLLCQDVFDTLPYTRDVTLPTLTMLSVDNPDILRHMKTPNLLRLELSGVTSSSQLEGLDLRCLVKLLIRPSGNTVLTYYLDPEEYPALAELFIDFGWAPRDWVQTSLLLLTTIVIASNRSPSSHGDIFCVSLLYNPELLPSLQQVFLSDFVEWDLLFLMLKRRNFGLKDVQKIQSFTVPFIPFEFRRHLALLLNGQQSQEDFEYDASLESTRSLVCDPEV